MEAGPAAWVRALVGRGSVPPLGVRVRPGPAGSLSSRVGSFKWDQEQDSDWILCSMFVY